jgi:hypothetical protein
MRDSYTNPSETNRIFWDFWSYETNPRNESFEHRCTKRIHETNLLNTILGIRESGPQDSYGFVVCLCSKDTWGFVGFIGFVKKGRILSKTVYETNPRYGYLKTLVTNRNKTNFFKSGFVIHDTVRIHGFAKRIHVFTNLLYESRILSVYPTRIS